MKNMRIILEVEGLCLLSRKNFVVANRIFNKFLDCGLNLKKFKKLTKRY